MTRGRTGRTARMIEAVVAAARGGESVVVVAATAAMVDTLVPRILMAFIGSGVGGADISAERDQINVTTALGKRTTVRVIPGPHPGFRWYPVPVMNGMAADTKYFVDHLAAEVRLSFLKKQTAVVETLAERWNR